ncbi:ImmA/IrrE family metallo-endopeptidase [Corynebacterium heidelbergense]
MGPSVFLAQLDGDTYGMVIGTSTGAEIYVSRSQSKTRSRFTCAHELGHFVDCVQNDGGLSNGVGYVDKRSDNDRGRAYEVYANEFAASILMPEEAVRRFIGDGLSLYQMADRFDVPIDSMSRRLHTLRVRTSDPASTAGEIPD